MQTTKRTYHTKKDLFSFARYIVSDERRLKKQIECHEKLRAGTINPMPWSHAERVVTEDDWKDWIVWKNQKQTT